jgi:hypothetical protein
MVFSYSPVVDHGSILFFSDSPPDEASERIEKFQGSAEKR